MIKPEDHIQQAIVRYCQLKHIVCHSVPNEAVGRGCAPRQAMIRVEHLKTMGLLPGCADLVVWFPMQTGVCIGYVEVKQEKGHQSVHQKQFQEVCRSANVPYMVVRSLDDFDRLCKDICGNGRKG
jgi:uncharacterized protein with ACT and thioredoxin-like domain